ncbi:viral A-type inclusion protein [Reticulomyxa filosa]|uniref:Viral A-type inclusion protein n=1 Tax=Reticulomyxa filosa TaxID=46433 RepID=X6PBJ0_RETFI|nr:viral A-type inclusion protein [Reticulomyxa filosa]|eukprot:ETO35483.1 viral A-type inclusion protein [Reticulomyxa filosa]
MSFKSQGNVTATKEFLGNDPFEPQKYDPKQTEVIEKQLMASKNIKCESTKKVMACCCVVILCTLGTQGNEKIGSESATFNEFREIDKQIKREQVKAEGGIGASLDDHESDERKQQKNVIYFEEMNTGAQPFEALLDCYQTLKNMYTKIEEMRIQLEIQNETHIGAQKKYWQMAAQMRLKADKLYKALELKRQEMKALNEKLAECEEVISVSKQYCNEMDSCLNDMKIATNRKLNEQKIYYCNILSELSSLNNEIKRYYGMIDETTKEHQKLRAMVFIKEARLSHMTAKGSALQGKIGNISRELKTIESNLNTAYKMKALEVHRNAIINEMLKMEVMKSEQIQSMYRLNAIEERIKSHQFEKKLNTIRKHAFPVSANLQDKLEAVQRNAIEMRDDMQRLHAVLDNDSSAQGDVPDDAKDEAKNRQVIDTNIKKRQEFIKKTKRKMSFIDEMLTVLNDEKKMGLLKDFQTEMEKNTFEVKHKKGNRSQLGILEEVIAQDEIVEEKENWSDNDSVRMHQDVENDTELEVDTDRETESTFARI